MKPELLQEIGLTEGETKVYLTLLKLGETKTGPLAKEAEVSSSKVYKILDRLTKKGLIGQVIKGKIKYFSAVEPKRLLEYMDEKEKELRKKRDLVEELIPRLELEQKLASRPHAVLYEGFKAVINLFRSILTELKSGEEYWVLGATYNDVPALRPFFHNYHNQRSRKGIKIKMLANFNIKDSIESSTKLKAEIRYLPQYLITNMEIVFYRKKAFIILWTKSPTGFLIENEEAVKSFEKYFDAFWKIADK